MNVNEALVKSFQAQAVAEALEVEQEASVANAESLLEESETIVLPQKFENKDIGKRVTNTSKDGTEKIQTLSVLVRKEGDDAFSGQFARQFNQNNQRYGLNEPLLTNLVGKIFFDLKSFEADDDKSAEEKIIEFVVGQSNKEGISDVAQIDRIFDFLIELASSWSRQPNEERKVLFENLASRLTSTKDNYNKDNAAAIKLGHQLIGASDIMVKSGKVATSEALEQIRTKIHDPKDLATQFNFYLSKGYTFKAINQELRETLVYIGRAVKTHEIERPLLGALMMTVKCSQAGIDIFRVFKRSGEIWDRVLDQQEVSRPAHLTFEKMGFAFMELTGKRYASKEEVRNSIDKLVGG
jgi:hypothetical protein